MNIAAADTLMGIFGYRRATFTPEEIKEIRYNAGMTQGQLSEYLGCHYSAVSHWEAGRRKPSGTVIKMLYALRESFN